MAFLRRQGHSEQSDRRQHLGRDNWYPGHNARRGERRRSDDQRWHHGHHRLLAAVLTAGTISGGTNSVLFTGGAGVTNTLTLQTGSKLIGDAVGSAAAGATNNLVLQGSGTANNNFKTSTHWRCRTRQLEVERRRNRRSGHAPSRRHLAINAVLTGTTVTVNICRAGVRCRYHRMASVP